MPQPILKTEIPGTRKFLEMIHVKKGSFKMGNKQFNKSQPVHEVEVPAFYLGILPITTEQFVPFLNGKGNQEEGGRRWVNLEGKNRGVKCGIRIKAGQYECIKGLERHPMVYVNWYGAKAYCEWLSIQSGENFRLPSEAEWEYAARGGSESKEFPYAGSHKLKEVGWYNKNSHNQTSPVGLKQPNELGLYDMSGNVWEWCADHWHENYEGAPTDGSAWVTGGDAIRRVIRGGSWYLSDFYCRVAYRNRVRLPVTGDNNIGFRVARY